MTIIPRRWRVGGLLLILAALPLLGACRSDGGSSSSNSYSSSNGNSGGDGTTTSTSYTIDKTVRTISLDSRAGHVTVRAKDGPVGVTERARYTDSKPVTSHGVSGDTLELREQGCPNRPVNATCQVEWDITAPRGTVLDLRTDAGGIELQAMSGQVMASADSGGVEAHELASRQVSAKADAGGIELDFAQAPDDVTAVAQSGGVDISLPAATAYAVQAHTEAGGKEIDVREDPGSPHRINAQSDAGGVNITTR